MLIRRHPDLNWGKRICSPSPYHSAMPPKRSKIDENSPPLFYCTCILNPPFLSLIPFLKETFLFLIGVDPSLWLYSILKDTIPKNFPSLFYWKIKCGFSVTKTKIQDKLEPLTIDCKFMNDSWIWISNCVSLMT